MPKRVARDPLERIREKIEYLPITGCWLYTGGLSKAGYGVISIGSKTNGSRKSVLVHRWLYKQLVGPVPDELELDHVKARGCVGPICVNPDHLEPVTHSENIKRGRITGCVLFQRGKTHCPKGHEYAGENLMRYGGKRACRTCKNFLKREARARRKMNDSPL